jgi:2-dehydropantoate 2-reductase
MCNPPPHQPQAHFTPLALLIFGAGAIGTYVGGSLALSGHAVTFLERPEVAHQLHCQGLVIHWKDAVRPASFGRTGRSGESSQIPAVSPPPASRPSSQSVVIAASLAEAFTCGPFDAAIFALKSYDTAGVLQDIEPYLLSVPPVVCLQNGVDNEPALSESLGTERVIAGTVTSAVGRLAAGNVVLERRRGIGIAAGHPLSSKLVSALEAAGLNARLIARASDMKWSKLLTNLLANASAAILDMTPAEVFAHPALFRLELAQLRECLAVMSARGIHPLDLPGTPVRALAWAIRYLPPALARPLLAKAVGSGRGGKMPSFHIDLHAGRHSEVGYLNGAVVRAGEACGVPTPVNRLLTQTLLALTAREIPLDRFSHQPERLLNLL